jgi:hypothetical protein
MPVDGSANIGLPVAIFIPNDLCLEMLFET